MAKKTKASKPKITNTMKLDDQICFSLYLAAKTMTQVYQPVLKPFDLTYPQYIALLVLWERDGISVKDLGERLHLDSGTLSPLLKKLEARGLVERSRDPDDERSVTLVVTQEGHALKRKLQPELDAMACALPVQGSELKSLRDAANAFTRLLLTSDE